MTGVIVEFTQGGVHLGLWSDGFLGIWDDIHGVSGDYKLDPETAVSLASKLLQWATAQREV